MTFLVKVKGPESDALIVANWMLQLQVAQASLKRVKSHVFQVCSASRSISTVHCAAFLAIPENGGGKDLQAAPADCAARLC